MSLCDREGDSNYYCDGVVGNEFYGRVCRPVASPAPKQISASSKVLLNSRLIVI